ncbi:hypothetical protein ILYODFUR_032698, partial [Ilyodon furcidens]
MSQEIIKEGDPLQGVAFSWGPRHGYHTTEASSGEEEVPRGFFIYSPLLANEKFMKEVSGIRRPEISLCRSKTNLLWPDETENKVVFIMQPFHKGQICGVFNQYLSCIPT